MRTKHCILATFILGSFTLTAQNTTVQNWANSHPNVVFVESNDASDAYLQSLTTNNIPFIVYDSEISLSDIQAFEGKHKPMEVSDLDEASAMEIKRWRAEHPNVKIIKRSFFNQMDASKQQLYQTNGALILTGETITLNDIRNYE